MMRPLGCRALVRLDARPDTYVPGGRIVTCDALGRESEHAHTQPVTATVLAVGRGTPDDPMPLVVGECVLIGQYNGIKVEPHLVDPNADPRDESYWMLDCRPSKQFPDVYGVVEERGENERPEVPAIPRRK
jgi:co-chaperonin GroES (HSP10)